jgi:O-antigen/teichoic acid export membrane protein
MGVGLLMWLCPRYGPLGAAISVTTARLAGTMLRHVVLLRIPEFASVPRTQKVIWLKILAGSVFIAAVGWIWQLPLLGQIVLVGGVSLLLLRSTAHVLDVTRSFPELLRLPLFSRMVGRSPAP